MKHFSKKDFNKVSDQSDEQRSIEHGQKPITKFDPEYEFLVKLVKLVTSAGVPAQEIKDLASAYPFETVDDIGDLAAKIWTLAVEKYSVPREWLFNKLPKNASLTRVAAATDLTQFALDDKQIQQHFKNRGVDIVDVVNSLPNFTIKYFTKDLERQVPSLKDKTNGFYDFQGGTLFINPRLSLDQKRLTIIHEIEHAIQDTIGMLPVHTEEDMTKVKRTPYWERTFEVGARQQQYNALRQRGMSLEEIEQDYIKRYKVPSWAVEEIHNEIEQSEDIYQEMMPESVMASKHTDLNKLAASINVGDKVRLLPFEDVSEQFGEIRQINNKPDNVTYVVNIAPEYREENDADGFVEVTQDQIEVVNSIPKVSPKPDSDKLYELFVMSLPTELSSQTILSKLYQALASILGDNVTNVEIISKGPHPTTVDFCWQFLVVGPKDMLNVVSYELDPEVNTWIVDGPYLAGSSAEDSIKQLPTFNKNDKLDQLLEQLNKTKDPIKKQKIVKQIDNLKRAKQADLWPAQEQAQDMLSHEHNSLSYNNDQEPDTSVSGPRPDVSQQESVWDIVVDKFFKNHESWSSVVQALQQANPDITNDDITLLKEKVKQSLDKQMNFTASKKKLNINNVVEILNAKDNKVVNINTIDHTIELMDGTTVSFDDAVKMAMEIDKTGVFSGAEFSTTDFNTQPTLDNGPFSSPEDHGAKPQKSPFPNTNWLPADDQNLDEEPYSNVAAELLNRSFNKKARMDAPAWIDPSGKIFTFSDNTHDTWAETNAQMLKNQYNLDLAKMDPNTDSAVSYLIDNGWTRSAVADTAIVLNTKDIGHIDQLDNYVAQNWKPDFKYVLIETFNGNWVVNDPFPTLSKGVQKSKRLGKKASVDGQAINQIVDKIHANGGVTYNLFRGDLSGTPNYAVSIYPEREQIVDGADFDRIEGYVDDNEDLLNNARNSFGAWLNGDKLYLDVVVTTPDQALATELAKQHNQLAIWDLKNSVEIPINQSVRAFSKNSMSVLKTAEENMLCQEDQNQIAAASSPAYVIAINNYVDALKLGHNKERSLKYAVESVSNIEQINANKLTEFINTYVNDAMI